MNKAAWCGIKSLLQKEALVATAPFVIFNSDSFPSDLAEFKNDPVSDVRSFAFYFVSFFHVYSIDLLVVPLHPSINPSA